MGNHDYDKFEGELHRRGAAERLIAAIAEELRNGRDAWDDRWHPSEAEVDALIDRWLVPGTVVCQDPHSGKCPGPQECGRRCTVGYWRVHGEDVAANMAALARAVREDEPLWHLAGRIHDIDYPAAPHHAPDVDSERAHPMGLARELHELGAAPALTLAILAHAPHLQLRPASPLAWALLACDEHATMTAFAKTDREMEPRYPEQLHALASVLRPASSTIRGGFRRKDMQARADGGLQKLLDYQRGAIPRFDAAGFDARIDWKKDLAS